MKKSLLFLAIILLAFVLVSCGTDNSVGEVEIKIYDFEENEVFKEVISFDEEDTLEKILKEHDKIKMKGEEASFGFYIVEMMGISSNDYQNSFWNIKVNGEDSMVGIRLIELADKDVIEFHLISF